MISARALAAPTVFVLAMTGLAGCGSSPPSLDATGSKAFAYDIGHRKLAGPVYEGSDPKHVLSLGRAMCGLLDKGHSPAQLDAALQADKTLAATAEQDGEFITTVVATLCPKYVNQITGPTSAGATPTKG